jgi:hypothetical protein
MSQQPVPPLVGVFSDQGNADSAIEGFRQTNIPEKQVRVFSKDAEPGIFRLFGRHRGEAEALERELKERGSTPDEANFYRREYEAGHIVVVVDAGMYQQEARMVLNSNGASTYARYQQKRESPSVRSEETHATKEGAVTPGMRPDDSSQSGIATTADGTQAAQIDPVTLDADLQNLRQRSDERQQQ